jgi:hypothetical protein
MTLRRGSLVARFLVGTALNPCLDLALHRTW